ncbi:hypothetical protein DFH09DRAFT_429601 [Mycena vulgaris]|nr:hypothetical protein DFH09DRAFT_429601 [Mycena vulgaris]
MSSPIILWTLLGGFFVCLLIARRKRHPGPLPPGPPGIPILGNALHLPLETPWVAYQSWAKQYGKRTLSRSQGPLSDSGAGDIVHVSAFGQHIILLNSEETVLDLLERRSAIYSDRPQLCMSGIL